MYIYVKCIYIKKLIVFFCLYIDAKMDQFEHAMLAQGVPMEAINRIRTSPVWIDQFKQYSQFHVDTLIYLFPKIYHTVKWVPNEQEIENARKNYAPMDTTA